MLSDFVKGRADQLIELQGDESQRRGDSQGDQRQLPLHGKQHEQRAYKVAQVLDYAEEPTGNKAPDTVDIAGQPGHNFADAVLIIKPVRQLLQMVIHPLPQIEYRVLGYAFRQVAAHVTHHHADEHQPDHGAQQRQ